MIKEPTTDVDIANLRLALSLLVSGAQISASRTYRKGGEWWKIDCIDIPIGIGGYGRVLVRPSSAGWQGYAINDEGYETPLVHKASTFDAVMCDALGCVLLLRGKNADKLAEDRDMGVKAE
jgi:hypothetical protein